MNSKLRHDFREEHEIVTVPEAGWAGKKNGELLLVAEERFDVLLSTDKGIPHQQDVSRFDLAFVLLRARSNAYGDLAPLMDEVDEVLASARPGIVVRIPSSRTGTTDTGDL